MHQLIDHISGGSDLLCDDLLILILEFSNHIKIGKKSMYYELYF